MKLKNKKLKWTGFIYAITLFIIILLYNNSVISKSMKYCLFVILGIIVTYLNIKYTKEDKSN